ncbi:flagellar filament capping protein FliD [Telmatospirillum sp.]|uniref:flagellar filament capping protein FliD n=1 Tax=Telmatospirillum sp. TaxID=2079197 RepID=UPI0028480974|nr:flagellar filament capping protein FliD [Telmatospirillum sp.]MDR3440806.1 flagellar filament capping protein FliD [Telmatospirillum sp.]
MSTITSSASVSTGNATDVSGLTGSSYSLSIAEAVSTKVQPYLTRADTIATEINTNKSKITAYQSMQSALVTLKAAAANLSSQPTTGTNVFNSRSANLTSASIISGGTPSNASTLLSATVTAGTNTGTHSVVVNQIASAEEDVSSTIAFSSTAKLGYTGTFSIAETGKTASAITVTSTMSLSDIASAINGSEAQTGVSASVVSISSTQSVLVLSGSDTNTALQFSDGSNILSNLGVYSTPSSTLTGTTAEANTTAALGLAGTFTINGGTDGSGTAKGVTVTITSTMSLADIVSTINTKAQSVLGSTTTFAASATGTNQLQLTTGSSDTVSFSGISGDVLTGLGVSEIAANGATNQVQAAQAANLTIDGVSGISRDSNVVTDVLSGVTLNLTAADPNTQITLTIAPNTTAAASAINAFASAYNNWESFVQQNEATQSDGTAAASAVLFGDSTLRSTSLDIDNTITSMINNMSLGDIGLSLNASNSIEVDSTTLSSALTDKYTSVVGMFQSQLSTSNYALQALGTDYSSYSGTFALDITTNASGTITNLGGAAASSFRISGSHLIGITGTAYSGMSFSFSGTAGATTTVTVTATVGMANQLYTTSNNYGNSLNGTVESLVETLQDEDKNLTSRYDSIINDANKYTTYLLQQYASLSTQIASASYTTTVLNDMFKMQTS